MKPTLPFEAPLAQIIANPDPFVTAVFDTLQSEFLVMPKGPGFVDYAIFEEGYEALKQATDGFRHFTPDPILRALQASPISLVVLRTILGLTPPEWAYLATQRSGVDIQQGFARSLDRKVRLHPTKPLPLSAHALPRLRALVSAACDLVSEGPPPTESDKLHRLHKADTHQGVASVERAASMGVPYAILLYERFLGRPFAGHRDSVSEMVGDTLEVAIEEVLSVAHISYRKTRRAQRIPGFDQAPDFVVPSEFNPRVVIEAKVTEDDGTARDKVTRIQHLAELASKDTDPDHPKFEVIACIGGRGFGVRREDMKKLLIATRGKVYTFKTLSRMIETSSLRNFGTT